MSQTEASLAILGLRADKTISLLIDAGYLATTTAWNADARRNDVLVVTASIEEFNEKYVSLNRFTEGTGQHSRRAVALLEYIGLTPIFPEEVCNRYFYDTQKLMDILGNPQNLFENVKKRIEEFSAKYVTMYEMCVKYKMRQAHFQSITRSAEIEPKIKLSRAKIAYYSRREVEHLCEGCSEILNERRVAKKLRAIARAATLAE